MPNSNYRHSIDAVKQYIQENISEELTLAKLAAVAGFSVYHFHRIFSAMEGVTLGVYLQDIRMKQARESVLDTESSITSIALDAGYSTPAAFNKAFKRIYAIAPLAMRRNGRAVEVVPLLPPATWTDEYEWRSGMRISVQQLPARRVIYAERKGTIDENYILAAQEAFAALDAYIAKYKLQSVLGDCLAITPDDPQEIEPDERRFQAGYFVKTGRPLPPDDQVQEMIIPAMRTVVIEYKGPYSGLWHVWEEFYRDWLPASGELPADFPAYEVYVQDPNVRSSLDLRTNICVPIQEGGIARKLERNEVMPSEFVERPVYLDRKQDS